MSVITKKEFVAGKLATRVIADKINPKITEWIEKYPRDQTVFVIIDKDEDSELLTQKLKDAGWNVSKKTFFQQIAQVGFGIPDDNDVKERQVVELRLS